MHSSTFAAEAPPSDATLRTVLQRALADVGVSAPRVIRRRPSKHRTSFPLEELELTMENGAELHIAFKRLGWDALDDTARLAKPRFLHDSRREPSVYETILANAVQGPPRYFGSAIDAEAAGCWLFVEWVDGRELYQVGDRSLWEATARWLGEMHLNLSGSAGAVAEKGRLLDYDRAYYRRWIDRARQFGRASELVEEGRLEWLGKRYEPVVEGLLELPKTIVHGEFYASNVLVGGRVSKPRISPVDWELAATAPGLIDLAALISGDWSPLDREAIVSAYRSSVGASAFSDRQLDLARLHLAVQWLGWAPRSWVPPRGQRHDWLAEALALAGKLEL